MVKQVLPGGAGIETAADLFPNMKTD
jgi:hypothetical protein